MAEYATPAPVMDECIHEMTTAFCSLCKAETRRREGLRRASRNRDHPAWQTEDDLPYPSTQAKFASPCKECDVPIEVDDWVFRCESKWVCYSCACDFKTLGIGADD